MIKKSCTKCKKTLELRDFAARVNGNLHSWCKECKRNYDRVAAAARRRAARAGAELARVRVG